MFDAAISDDAGVGLSHPTELCSSCTVFKNYLVRCTNASTPQKKRSILPWRLRHFFPAKR